MARLKKSILALSIAFIVSILSAFILFLPKNVLATNGENITVSDDFTKITTSQSVAFSKSNIVFDANEHHGAVPGSTWGASVSGGDAELVYKISSDDGFVLSGATLSFTVGSGHGSGVYWYNGIKQNGDESKNVLGNNLIVYVSDDNSTWTPIYNLDEKEKPVQKAQDYFSNKYSPELDLTSYVNNATDLYVKFEILHFTTAECNIPTWTTGIPLNQVGLGMYAVSITATQGEVTAITKSSDFTTAGPAVASNGLYDYNNVVTDGNNGHLTYGLLPAEAWGAKVKILNDAYVTYKLKATNGYAISTLAIDLDVSFGHSGIVSQASKSDIVVAVSYNDVSYTDIYSLRADETAVAVGENTPKGVDITQEDKRYELSLDLSDKIFGSGEMYVRIKIVSPHYSELTEVGLETDKNGDKIVALGNVGSRLYSVDITANQSKIPEVKVSNNWGDGGIVSSFAGLVDFDGVTKDVNSGNTTFGLVPASNWGEPVNSISTGYVTYKISATDNYVFNNLVLNMNLRYGTNNENFKNGNSDFIVYVSYDGINFTKAYSLYEDKGISSMSVMKVSVDLTSYAKNYGVMLVKIEMKCPLTELVNLDKIPTCLLGVDLIATQASVVSDTFSISDEFGNDKGTNLTANYPNIVDSSNVFDGNATFALIPSAGWGGSVNATSGYVTYKLTAPSDKSFNNIRLQLAFKLKSGANLIVSTSYDGVGFNEFYNAQKVLGDKAYNNNLTWTKGQDNNSYQMLDIDLKASVETATTVYVKIAMEHPEEYCTLQALKSEIFSVKFSGNYSDYSPNIGKIVYNLDGGGYESVSNPVTYKAEDGIITLINPVKQYSQFLGWYTNPDFTGDPVTFIDASVITTHRLYAKWQLAEYSLDIRIAGTGSGTLKLNDEAVVSGIKKVNGGANVKFELVADETSILYSLNIDGADVFLLDGATYNFRNIAKDTVIIATFNARETIKGDFFIDYTDNVKYGNKWKNGLYDFANLYITDDQRHALGINGGQGYVTYKFEAPDGKYFESATLTTYAKLFDNYLLGTNEKVDYYVSYNDLEYTLIYKSSFNRSGENYVTVVQNLTEYVIGRQSFFLKVEIGSNSTNWTLVNNLGIEFTYETVELTVNYGGLYSDVTYTQYKGLPFDSSVINVKDGYALTDTTVYADENYQTPLSLTDNVMLDITVYVKAIEADGSISYVLNGGENNPDNPSVYNSNTAIQLKDPTKDGYTFAGWYTDASFTNLIVEIVQGRIGNITVYAKWISNQPPVIDFYGTITYVLDGGINNAANPTEYVYGDVITFATPTKDGYTFDGWYTSADFTTKITGITAQSTGNITVYAKWTAITPDQPTPPASSGGCGGSLDTLFIVGIVTLIAGTILVVSKKFRKN